MLDNLCDYIHDKLEELDHKVKTEGGLEGHEVQCGDMLAHFAKNLATYKAMLEADETGDGYSRRGRSYAAEDMRGGNGRSYRNDRGYDMRGRRGPRGYSGAAMDDLAQSMTDAMPDMPDDLRREAQRLLSKMQQM